MLLTRCLVVVALGSALAAFAERSHADDKSGAAPSKAACLSAYEETQTSRSAGKLGRAREQAIVCAAAQCPKAISTECTAWLGEIDKALPSVVFAVKAPSGEELFDVTVTMDGAPLASSIDTRAVPVDPGKHSFSFRSKEHGEATAQVTVREGEKNVLVEAAFAKPEAPGTGPEPDAVPEGAGAEASGGGPGPAFWVLGAVGIAGVGVGVTFEALGLVKQGELEECKPRCPAEEVDAMTTNFIVGDVSLAAGIVSLAAATLVGLLDSGGEEPKRAARVVPLLAPLPRGSAPGHDGARGLSLGVAGSF